MSPLCEGKVDMTQVATELQAAILPITKIVVKGVDGNETTYRLVLDYNAIAKAEGVVGRDLSRTENWVKLSGAQLSAIVWSALDKYHKEVTLEECRSWLAPAQQGQLFEMLIEQCYPGILARIEKSMAEIPVGETEPNAPAEK
jgi:hypothetical protein